MFLKTDSVGIILKGCNRMEIASLLRLFNGWRTLVGHVNNVTPVMGGKFIWLGYLM